MKPNNNNTVFDIDTDGLLVKSAEDGLYVMPWKILHDGYEATRQDGVVDVDADAGIPWSHSRFSATGKILSCKIYCDNEKLWNIWFEQATNFRLLPFWFYDAKTNGFSRGKITEQPTVSPAGTSINGVYVQLKIYVIPRTITIANYVTEDVANNYVEENGNLIYTNNKEVNY